MSHVPAIADCGLFGTTCDGNTYLQVRRRRALALAAAAAPGPEPANRTLADLRARARATRGSLIRHTPHARAHVPARLAPPLAPFVNV